MRRIGTGSGASISLIVAFVFPAMIGAALALAYYGFQYADTVSRPIEALFREYSREEAEKMVSEFETRVDQPALALFEKVAAERKEPTATPACEINPGPAIDSYQVLNADKKEECHWPSGNAASKHLRAFWNDYRGKLEWDLVRIGSWHHFHELEDGHSVLVVYTARKTEDDRGYFVAARMNMEVIGKKWLDESLVKLRKNLRVAVIDDDGNLVAGAPLGRADREERFLLEDRFGKALYRWRLQVAPQNVDAFQAQAERQKKLRPLLIVLSTVIMVVGLGIVWLVMAAERRTSRLKSDFIANVSHELKTPLSLIRMFGELVATGRHKGEEAAKEYGGIITRESERLSHLIDNVLDFARLERGKASYDFAEGDMADLLERALDVCRYRLDKEKLKLRTQIDLQLPPVRMDENAITLVILNLVDNAMKYAVDGKFVDVSLGRSPGGVVLSVRDHGPGIAADEQARIFERFYRARAARDRNVRGSGIGLALVQYIAEAHGGRVTVESPVAGEPGALFRVHLPAPVPEIAETPAPQAAGVKS